MSTTAGGTATAAVPIRGGPNDGEETFVAMEDDAGMVPRSVGDAPTTAGEPGVVPEGAPTGVTAPYGVTVPVAPDAPPVIEALPAASPDPAFEELVRHVAAELSQLAGDETAAGLGPFPFPFRVRRSGIYTRKVPFLPPDPLPRPAVPGVSAGPGDDGTHGGRPTPELRAPADGAIAGAGLSLTYEELRVDVDGRFPTMTVSGTISRLFGGRLTWIARVAWDAAAHAWAGPISYRDGVSSLEPHTDVHVRLTGGWFLGLPMTATATFSGGGAADSTRSYRFSKAPFREVGVEFDCVSDATAVTSYDLGSHPNRPADLPAVTLTIESAYSRLGVKMTNTGATDVVPVADAGGNATWSNVEMHDAMQVHWSVNADVPQWQVWTLFAGQHDLGPQLGGIMFDTFGAAERQGCAVFSNSFISTPPAGDPDGSAAVQRMRFWTAMHEIGHCFNLAHSWQKSLGTAWVPLADVPEARSYMNYPYRVAGGPAAFFADFHYGFDDDELLFLRHAPERFVEPGAAPWFDHHAFEQARLMSATTLELTLRVNRAEARYEALEPVVAELKLKNASAAAVLVDRNLLRQDDLTVVIARDRAEPRRLVPFARSCYLPEPYLLQPGESLYAPLFLSAGLNGLDLAEPGRYTVYAALRTAGGDVMSAPMRLEVRPPASREVERVAPDVLTDEVGRVLAFGGSRVLGRANAVLRDVVERLPDSALAVHAASALGYVEAVPGRVLVEHDPEHKEIGVTESRPDRALAMLATAYADLGRAADTLGHIRVTETVEQTARALAETDARPAAAQLAASLAGTLGQRGVLPSVVRRVQETAAALSA